MMKTGLICAILLCLTACSSLPTREGYAQRVQYWQGRDVNELLASWGAPDKTMIMPNGNTLYSYLNNFTQQQPLYSNTYYEAGDRVVIDTGNGQRRVIERPGRWVGGGVMGGGSVNYRCNTNFVVDIKTQQINAVSFEGNNCVAPERK